MRPSARLRHPCVVYPQKCTPPSCCASTWDGWTNESASSPLSTVLALTAPQWSFASPSPWLKLCSALSFVPACATAPTDGQPRPLLSRSDRLSGAPRPATNASPTVKAINPLHSCPWHPDHCSVRVARAAKTAFLFCWPAQVPAGGHANNKIDSVRKPREQSEHQRFPSKSSIVARHLHDRPRSV